MSTEWSVVGPRKGRKHKRPAGQTHAHRSSSSSSSSSSSALGRNGDGAGSATSSLTVDAVVSSLQRLQQRLRASEVGAHVLAIVREHYGATPPHAIVAYGIGNFSMHEGPMLQMALLLLLQEQLRPAQPVTVSDPVFSELEISALAALGLEHKASDDGRRRVCAPTLFYMPHCEHFMYNNVVASNAGDASRLVTIFGNSFRGYADRCLLTAASTTRESVDHVAAASSVVQEQMLWSERFKLHPRECHDELASLEAAFNDSAFITFPAR